MNVINQHLDKENTVFTNNAKTNSIQESWEESFNSGLFVIFSFVKRMQIVGLVPLPFFNCLP
jgi:hypothetical protein